ncbi:ABC transporter substrate-binding protein [Thermoanaerobacterium thermosaccharolyticum]|uniref:ABC transporter substrate-binding protein n=1 Tax=Thermoanaerobacterium thermosaccharolyticum TaxID=1517 RepID=A0A223I208_THETR|nr:ABC transporter substrate-binding protein [Thermoanaerobacterium thermosaccharolyticum]AST58776.1 ABC transporter substrate-binding protein [Thermoanaerobacterium thermosaccharolyticum]PHO06789.1 ABC transporter substrate-binding protein [Thermoanaerobacterium thermosaccharolyticum]
MKPNKWMKDMTFKEKVEYIWDYYKIHIIVGVVVIAIIVSFVNSIINNKDYVFDFSLIGTSINFDKEMSFQSTVTKELLGSDKGKKQALVEFYMLTKGSDGKYKLDPTSVQKLMVKISAQEVNVIALDKDNFNALAKQGAFMNLDFIKELDLSGFKTERLPSSKDVKAGTYGIDLNKGNKYLDEIGYDYHDKVIAIVSNSQNKDLSIKFLKWILDMK